MRELVFRPRNADPLWRRLADALPPRVVCGLIVLVGPFIPLLLMNYPMNVTIAAVVGVLGVCLVLSSPFLGLLIFLGLLYFRPEEFFPALAGARMTLLVSTVALLAWAINALLCRESCYFDRPAVRCLVGFVVVAVGSTALCGSGTVGEVALDMLKLLIMFVLIVHLVNKEERLQVSVTTLVLLTAILGVRTIWQFQHGESLIESEGEMRALGTGIFGDPNDLALAMAMALPLALGAVFGASRLWTRLWNLGAAISLVWTIFLTNSRGGVLALATAIFLFFGRRLGRVGLIIGGLAVFALFSFGPSRTSEMSAEEESAQGRVEAWEAGLDMLQTSPVWGVGREQFVEHHHRTAHNSLVLCLAELGLSGTVFWIGLFYFAFRDGQWLARRTGSAAPCERFPDPLPRDILLTSSPDTQHSAMDRSPGGASERASARPQASHSALLQISLVTFLVGGFFLSRTYWLPLYVFLGLTIAAAQIDAQASGVSLPGFAGRDWGRIAALTVAGLILVQCLIRL